MLLTMRLLVVMALCLCFTVPSPVLSFMLPEEKFAENQMTGAGEGATEQKEIDSIAKTLIRTVLDAAEEEAEEGTATDDEGALTLTKRAEASRSERELRRSFPLGRRNQMASRGSQLTARSKFTFGKRSPVQYSRPPAEQLLEELEKDAAMRNRDKLALLNDADLYNTLQDNHQVQKDAYSAFSFGKRGLSAFAFGKRGMPSFSFGKRGMPSFAFGKKAGPAFAFGRRDWVPTEQELEAPEELGPYEIKRNVAFAFGKRDNQ